jgi:hypothetical protein
MSSDPNLQALVGTPPGHQIRQAYHEASRDLHVKSSAFTLKKLVDDQQVSAEREGALQQLRLLLHRGIKPLGFQQEDDLRPLEATGHRSAQRDR